MKWTHIDSTSLDLHTINVKNNILLIRLTKNRERKKTYISFCHIHYIYILPNHFLNVSLLRKRKKRLFRNEQQLLSIYICLMYVVMN